MLYELVMHQMKQLETTDGLTNTNNTGYISLSGKERVIEHLLINSKSRNPDRHCSFQEASTFLEKIFSLEKETHIEVLVVDGEVQSMLEAKAYEQEYMLERYPIYINDIYSTRSIQENYS